MFTETGGEDLFFPDLSSRRWPQRRRLEDPQEVVEPWLPAAPTPQPLATQTKVSPEMRGASLFPPRAERGLDISGEKREGAADCAGRGREVFNLGALDVLEPSASRRVNQHSG